MVDLLIPVAQPCYLIEVSDTQNQLAVDRDWIVGIVERTLSLGKIPRASISLAFVDDASIRSINRRFLSHDWATDVISFRFSEDDGEELSGEIVISTEMALKSAREAQFEPLEELALYLVHGLLHLSGYNDQSVEEISAIRHQEAVVLQSLGIAYAFDRVPLVSATSDESVRESVRWPR